MGHVIQTTQSIMNILDKQEKNTGEKISSTHCLNKITENIALGVKLNFQCDGAINEFKKI